MLTDLATEFAPFAEQNPRLVIGLVSILIIVGLIAWALRLPSVRRDVRRNFLIVRNSLSPETRWADFRYWGFEAVGGALSVILLNFLTKKEAGWREFAFYVLVIICARFFTETLRAIEKSELLSRPQLGRVWRDDRKIRIAGILKKVNRLLESAAPASAEVVSGLLTDILTVAVSHVRDYRGNHKTVDVFGSLLLIDGDELVVVARDENLSSDKDLKREIGVRYKTEHMAAHRSIVTKRACAVGDYHLEYPDFPKNRKYRSILTIPLIASDDSRVIGVLSIDSSREYFFHSFAEGALASSLENSLAPYLRTVVLVLDCLVSRDSRQVIPFLTGHGKVGE